MATLTKKAQVEAEEAREKLREMLPPGSRVSTILRHVSRSGMSRSISPTVCVDGQPSDISWLVRRAVPGFQFDRTNGGIKMGGCGMDMGFSLVYTLSATLYPQGFTCSGEGDPDRWGSHCPSNDHSNGDRDYSPHVHSDGGYALRQEWL